MSILVAYASKHGATREVAERIAAKLQAAGQEAESRPVQSAGDLAARDAFVIGSAVYMGSWMREATQFVRRNRALLAGRPAWLFSSGPLGTAATDDQGRDLRDAAVPKEIAEFQEAIQPRDHRVFFGALNHRKFGFAERLLSALPAARTLLPEGDFRDWSEMEAWAERIAKEMADMPRARSAAL